jgi:hypothetical protein
MSDQIRADDPGVIWRNQPVEEVPVNVSQIVNRRAEEMSASTRSEILMSIGAAVLLAGVMAWRLEPANRRWLDVGFGAVGAWVAISLFRFRRWTGGDRTKPDAVASNGLEYYRGELERRRDHLRNIWIWHGPLLLASFMLIGIVAARAYSGVERLWSVLPLGVLLAAWIVFGLVRRLRLAQALQAEIDELDGK